MPLRRPTTRPDTPAIIRKIDPALPGVDETLDEFASISLPRLQVGFPTQHLVMTLLGEHWTGRTDGVASSALVDLLAPFGVGAAAARAALGRLAGRGALTLERSGRTTAYRPTATLNALLGQGRAITATFAGPRTGWDGQWTVLSWSLTGATAAPGHQLRQRLRAHGFAPLLPGTWVSPDPPPPDLGPVLAAVEGLRYTVVRGADPPLAGALSPAAAWDPEDMRPVYDEFIAAFGPAAAGRRRSLDTGEALVTRTRAVYRWFVIASIDPDLPSELLPTRWPRARAREVFVAVADRLAPAATEQARALLGPAHAPLVTTPVPYG
ncbi:MAG: PaaX family transcriptional regulator C-terminal domain-containing protein [Acidimicrobiales bacterium]